MARVTVAADEGALAEAAAGRVTSLVEESIATRGGAVVCLTGGETPRRLYELLGEERRPWRARVDWTRVHLFWGDERHVPPDHPESNFGMAKEALVGRVPIPPTQVHRMNGEIADAQIAAREYEEELRAGFALAGRSDRTFDVMLLGLGEDAHIASIFPGSPLLERADPGAPSSAKNVEGVWAEHLDAWRITLTLRALLDARAIVMLVAGRKKADAVRAALELPEDILRVPAQALRRAGDRAEWLIDRDAAAALKNPF